MEKSALVIGGGIAGMTASLDIADQGFKVYLVEKQDQLGGFVRNVDKIQDGTVAAELLNRVINRVEGHPNIQVFLNSEVADAGGFVGNFKATVKTGDTSTSIKFGAAVIAVGAEAFSPSGYFHYGENGRIVTQKKLESLLKANFTANRVVMIQCVGSREENRLYCSRVCCTEAIKNAIRIKQANADAEVYVLYRDIRSYGIWETLYREARKLGVVFLKYELDAKPEVDPADLTVTVREPLLGQKMKLKADLVVLSSAITPPKDADTLSKMFKVPLDANGFFLEAHVKLRPVDFATDGVFVCGTAHYPKMIYESIAQASAAASRACIVLSKDSLESEGAISVVDETRCKGCGTCVETCPFEAIELKSEETLLEKVKFEKRKAHVNPIVCKGCGSCAVACPLGAITMQHFSNQQIEASLEAVTMRVPISKQVKKEA